MVKWVLGSICHISAHFLSFEILDLLFKICFAHYLLKPDEEMSWSHLGLLVKHVLKKRCQFCSCPQKIPALKILLNSNNIEINFFLDELIWRFQQSWQQRQFIISCFCISLSLCIFHSLSFPVFVIHPCSYLLNKYGIELHIQQKGTSIFTSFSVFIFLLLFLTIKNFNASQFLCISILICFSIFYSLFLDI